ncbi:MAG TPA: Calx-beta domain-containing protein [Pirellulaceae bacterium]|jgi:hypothetical protein
MKTNRRSAVRHSAFRAPRSALARRLRLEPLEQRNLLTTFLESFGGSADELNNASQSIDPAGNLYTASRFYSQPADFDPGPGVANLSSAGASDAYVAKYNPDGALLWAMRFGGTDYDYALRAMYSNEAAGEFVYAAGIFAGTVDFGPGVGILTSAGGADAVLLKLDAATGATVWAKRFGGTADDAIYDFKLAGDNAVMAVRFQNTVDFDPGPATANLTAVNNYDAAVLTWDTSGNYVSAWQIGGMDNQTITNLQIEGNDLYLRGYFAGTADFDPGPGTANRTAAGTDWLNVFLGKYTTSGSLQWLQVIQSSSASSSRLTTDDTGLYYTGDFYGSVDFDPGPGTAILNGGASNDAVVAKYSKSDGSLLWAKSYGGSLGEFASTSLVDPLTGKLYVAGYFGSPTVDFNPAAPGGEVINGGTSPGPGLQTTDGFVLQLDTSTGAYQQVWQVSGPGMENARVEALIGGTLYLSGSFESTAAFPNGGTLTSQGGDDVFLMAFNLVPPPPQVSVAGVSRAEGTGGTTLFNFTVTRTGDSAGTTSVNWATADGSATAASGDYIAASGVLTFNPGETTKTISISVNADSLNESDESFAVLLANPSGGSILVGNAVANIINDDAPPTKFYVADDGSTNKTFEYAANGVAIENYAINSGNSTPRGAASTIAGDKVWVVDANKNVYVYSKSGGLLGSWSAGSLPSNADVQGVTTNGTDIWIVDAKGDKVYRYTGAASRLSGSQNAASSFTLNSSNGDPTDLVTDGTSIWIVNNARLTDKVFKYNLSGSLLGSWTIVSGGGSPTGITIDPSHVSDIWIVDSSTDKVYDFSAAASRISGSQSPASNFALASGNTNPQGIADPPPSSHASATDAALLLLMSDPSATITKRK